MFAPSSRTSPRMEGAFRGSFVPVPGVAAVHLLALCLLALQLLGCSEGRPRRNALLITIDTLRADYLHAYGFAAENSPNIDALAASGALFEHGIAAATLTAPAHASIMTSRYAREHSIGTLNGETRLAGGTTLAERFEAEGYDTAAFVSNVVLRRRSGLDRGFDVYDDELVMGEANRKAYFERRAQDTVERALAWLDQPRERPFFLWVHLQDPHGPYTPPPGFRGRIGEVELRFRRELVLLRENHGRGGIPHYQKLEDERRPGVYAARYAEEVMYADHWVGRLLEGVRARAGVEGTAIVLTADHGESMGEAGWFFQHGQSATPDLASVPFIVAAPGIAPSRHATPVSHVDVAPTLLELAGVGALDEVSGVSLVPLLETGREPGERDIFCDTDGEAALYTGGQVVRAAGGATSARRDQPQQPLRVEAIRPVEGGWRPASLEQQERERLARYVAARADLVLADEMQPEHVEQLRALGYLPPIEEEAPRPAAEGAPQ